MLKDFGNLLLMLIFYPFCTKSTTYLCRNAFKIRSKSWILCISRRTYYDSGRGIINHPNSTPVVLSFRPPKLFNKFNATNSFQIQKSVLTPFTEIFNIPDVNQPFYLLLNRAEGDKEYYFVQKDESCSVYRFISGEWSPENEKINFEPNQLYSIQGTNQFTSELAIKFGIKSKISFVDFLPLDQTVDFCRRVKFLCGTSYCFKEDQAKRLMIELSSNRDNMDYNTFMKIVSNIEGNNIIGTTNHQVHLGNIIEGLVIHTTNNDGSNLTKKYKFPYYTLRTMCIRSLLNSKIQLIYVA